MNQFIRAILTGDVEGIVGNADSILQVFENIEKERKWSYLKEHRVSDFNFGMRTIDNVIVKHDPTSKYLEPWNINTIENKSTFDYISKPMLIMNSYTKCWNTIIMFHLMFGRRFLDSKITQHFTAYLSLFSREPFIENGDGSIIIDDLCLDASVTLRTKLYIRCVWEEMTDKLDCDLLFEIYSFLFISPQKNTSALKTMKGPLLSVAMTRSTDGFLAAWTNEKLDEFVMKPVEYAYDEPTYLRLKKEVDIQLKEMEKSNLKLLAARFRKLVHDDITVKNVGEFSTLWFVEALSGIMRSSYSHTALASIEEAMSKKYVREGNLMSKYIYELWYQFFSGYITDIPDTQEEFVLELMTDLTTRSDGLNDKLNIDGVEVDNPERGKVFIDLGEGKGAIWKFKDKTMTFRYLLADPKSLFDFDRMQKSLTDADPGRLFARYVPARDVRMVYGVPLFRFNTERFTRPCVQFLSKIKYPDAIFGKEQTPTSTLAIDTGRYLTEMGHYLYLTGHPELRQLILLADYSNFDQTQTFDNFRVHMIKAAEQVRSDFAEELKKKEYDILGGKNIMDYIIGNWVSLRDAKFRVYTSRSKYLIMPTGWTLSGENATLVINTMTNMAVVRVVIDIVSVAKIQLSDGEHDFIEFIDFESFKLQGDDQIAILKRFPDGMSNQDTLKVQNMFLDILNTVTESGGLAISVNKTGLRYGHFEFLKKAGMFGWVVPRYMQISLEEQETINRTMDPIERMSARIGQYREYEWRGGSTKWGLVRRYMEWNISRRVNLGYNTEGDKEYDYLPFEIIWVPKGEGGVGMHPITNTDPNTDLMLKFYPLGTVRMLINKCIYLLRSAPKGDTKSIVDQVKPALAGGLNLQKEFDHKANSDIIQYSHKAYTLLLNAGMKPDKNAYFHRYDQELSEAIQDDKQMQKIKEKFKRHKAIYIVDHYNDSIDVHDYIGDMFLPGVTFQLLDYVDNSRLPECPVAGLDGFLSEWLRQVGTSSESKVATGDAFASLTKILAHSRFPRNLKANSIESICNSLLEMNLLDQTQISLFLIMRGAEPELAEQFSRAISGKLDMLKYLAGVTDFSFVGEGFTDKSMERINELVEFSDIALDNTTQFSQIIKSVAYQFMRTQPLWSVDGYTLNYNPRRKVLVSYDKSTVATFLEKNITVAMDEDTKTMFKNTMFSAKLAFI